jgi:putative DNA primase/helicase
MAEARRVLPAPSMPMAVARAFVESMYTTADGLSLRYHRGVPYMWNRTYWAPLASDDLRTQAYRYLENVDYVDRNGDLIPWSPARRKVDDLLDALPAVTSVESRREPPLWIDCVPDDLPAHEVVPMQNALLHVPTRTLLPHTSRFFGHHALPFEFLPAAPAPKRWLSFLSELWPDDKSSIDVLQEIVGYLLAGGTKLQKIFLLVGPKRAGKGTIGRVVSGLLGPHNLAAPSLSSLATNFGLSPLIGKSLALIADARWSSRSESHAVVERLLSISGEDSLTIDRKHREPWTGRLPTRFLILTNELPKLSDVSGALPSRFVLLVLTKSFYGEESPHLTNELLAEAPSIFTWGLSGLDRLLARGCFEQPSSSQEAIQRLEDLASPIRAFLRSNCIIASDARVPCERLWEMWKSWCEAENRHPSTRTVFGRDLHAAAPTVRRVRARGGDERRWEYLGIGVAAGVEYSSQNLGPLGRSTPDGPKGPKSATSYFSEDDRNGAVTDGRF